MERKLEVFADIKVLNSSGPIYLNM